MAFSAAVTSPMLSLPCGAQDEQDRPLHVGISVVRVFAVMGRQQMQGRLDRLIRLVDRAACELEASGVAPRGRQQR